MEKGFEMISINQWIHIIVAASTILLRVKSAEIFYDNVTRSVQVDPCENSTGNEDINKHVYSEEVDNLRFDSDLENALDIGFFAGCVITYIPRKLFKKLVLIEEVNLWLNDVEAIKGEDFRENKNLKRLFLYENELTELPEYLFRYTPLIEDVIFAYNKITRIDPNTFAEGVDNLKRIDLQGNRITTLHKNLFTKTIRLETLDVRYNQIVRFNCNILPHSLANKTTIYIQSNPTEKIDCFENWLTPFTNETEPKSYNGNDILESQNDSKMANKNLTNDQSMESNSMMDNKTDHNDNIDNGRFHTMKYILMFLAVVCVSFIVVKAVICLKHRTLNGQLA